MSSTATHTPGPWTVERRFACWAIVDSHGHDVTYQDVEPRFHNGEPCGSVTSRGKTPDELAYNARLIAAAPDMLAVLEKTLAWHEDCLHDRGQWGSPSREAYEMVRAAICKARGE